MKSMLICMLVSIAMLGCSTTTPGNAEIATRVENSDVDCFHSCVLDNLAVQGLGAFSECEDCLVDEKMAADGNDVAYIFLGKDSSAKDGFETDLISTSGLSIHDANWVPATDEPARPSFVVAISILDNSIVAQSAGGGAGVTESGQPGTVSENTKEISIRKETLLQYEILDLRTGPVQKGVLAKSVEKLFPFPSSSSSADDQVNKAVQDWANSPETVTLEDLLNTASSGWKQGTLESSIPLRGTNSGEDIESRPEDNLLALPKRAERKIVRAAEAGEFALAIQIARDENLTDSTLTRNPSVREALRLLDVELSKTLGPKIERLKEVTVTKDLGSWAELKSVVVAAEDSLTEIQSKVNLGDTLATISMIQLRTQIDRIEDEYLRMLPELFLQEEVESQSVFLEKFPFEPRLDSDAIRLVKGDEDGLLMPASYKKLHAYLRLPPRTEGWDQSAYADLVDRMFTNCLLIETEVDLREGTGRSLEYLYDLGSTIGEKTLSGLILVQDSSLSSEQFEILPDLPVRTVKLSDLGGRIPEEVIVAIIVTPTTPTLGLSQTHEKTVPARYLARENTVDNPEYEDVVEDLARMRERVSSSESSFRKTEQQFQQSRNQMAQTVSGSTSWAAAIVGTAAITGLAAIVESERSDLEELRVELRAAQEKLNKTPKTILEPIFDNYAIPGKEIELIRQVHVPYLIAQRANEQHGGVLSVNTSRSFTFLEAPLAADPDVDAYREQQSTSEDIEEFSYMTIRVPQSLLLQSIVDNHGSLDVKPDMLKP